MSATETSIDPHPMPRIRSVRAEDNFGVVVEWIEGVGASHTELVDLSPIIQQFKLYKPLRENRDLFESVRLANDGETLEWGDGEIDMAAESVERLAGEQMTGKDFRDFLERNGLTRKAAAAELGRSLRAIYLYTMSETPIPRVVALACKGYELSRNRPAIAGRSEDPTAVASDPSVFMVENPVRVALADRSQEVKFAGGELAKSKNTAASALSIKSAASRARKAKRRTDSVKKLKQK